jgi:uncharacterized OB-fold protein
VLCSNCYSFDSSPVDGGTGGVVHSWTVAHHAFAADLPAEPPYTLVTVDLPAGVNSGLRRAADILEGLPEIEVVRLGQRDVVRHPLVQTIVAAYEAAEEKAAAHDA